MISISEKALQLSDYIYEQRVSPITWTPVWCSVHWCLYQLGYAKHEIHQPGDRLKLTTHRKHVIGCNWSSQAPKKCEINENMSISQEDALVGNTRVLEIACANTQKNMMRTIYLSPWDMSHSMETGLWYPHHKACYLFMKTGLFKISIVKFGALYTSEVINILLSDF